MQEIDAIILAGGLGTRLKPVVEALPKALAPVCGRPFLDILLGLLNRWGFIRRVVIAVGYMAEKIIDEYGGGGQCAKYNFEILFSREEQLLGTGGAIIKALKYTQSAAVLAVNGDTFAGVDIEEFVLAHLKNGADMTIALKEMKDAARYGTITLDGQSKIVSFHEKSPQRGDGLINAGVYVFNRGLFKGGTDGVVMSLEREFLPLMLSGGGSLYGYCFDGRFIDIGVPEAYTMASDYLFDITQCGGRL